MAKDLEFDWDDKNTDPPIPEVTQKVKEVAAAGYSLAIPVGKNKFKAVDIAKASAEEFVSWFKFVYPLDNNIKSSDYKELSDRLRAYNLALNFHKASNLFVGRTLIPKKE
jgi:hypothetical protein